VDAWLPGARPAALRFGAGFPDDAARGDLHVIRSTLTRLVRNDDGMEMVEWAIVGVVFAVAAAAFWGDLATNVDAALGDIENTVNPTAP
jgi:Flp pilus assembly pilin Flp